MKNIGLLIPILVSGGAERVLCNISNILVEGHNVYLFVFDSSVIEYEFSGQLIDLKSRAKKNKLLKVLVRIKRTLKLKRLKRKFKLDVMISFLNAANMVNIYSKGREKVFVSCRGYSNYTAHRKKYAKHMGRIDRLIFQTERMKDEFLAEYQVDSKKIVVLSNPFDLDKIKGMSIAKADESFTSFVEGKKVLITVGSFKRDKGFWHLIKAFCLAWQQRRDICLVIIGHRGEMEEDIRRMAQNTPARDSILFLGYQQNPFKYMSRADIYLCSSLSEGFPNAIVEAMTCGAAVVSADCKTGPREILSLERGREAQGVDMAEYGVLCPAFDDEVDYSMENTNKQHECFRDAVLALLGDDTLLKRYRQAAADRSRDFGLDRFNSQLTALIDGTGMNDE